MSDSDDLEEELGKVLDVEDVTSMNSKIRSYWGKVVNLLTQNNVEPDSDIKTVMEFDNFPPEFSDQYDNDMDNSHIGWFIKYVLVELM